METPRPSRPTSPFPPLRLLAVVAAAVLTVQGAMLLFDRLALSPHSSLFVETALHVLILVSTPALIALNYFRELGAASVFAVSGVGVLGFAIGLRDLLYTRMSGIYENGLVWTASSAFYADVAGYRRGETGSIVVEMRDRAEKPIVEVDDAMLDRIAAKLDSAVRPLQ